MRGHSQTTFNPKIEKNEGKKNINLATPGIEPGLFLVIKFCQKNGTFMNGPS